MSGIETDLCNYPGCELPLDHIIHRLVDQDTHDPTGGTAAVEAAYDLAAPEHHELRIYLYKEEADLHVGYCISGDFAFMSTVTHVLAAYREHLT